MKKIIIKTVFSFILLSIFSFSFAQTAADKAFAEENFRRGVQAFYRGSFNDAIIQFEKALSYRQDESLISEWLGKAYYRAGMEDAALQQWIFASQNGYGGMMLENTIEIISGRRVFKSIFDSDIRYVEAGSFPATDGEITYYSRPVSVLPMKDGTCWVLAYGSNELLKYNINGKIIFRTRGPINGFDRPMDLIMTQAGYIAVTEYAGDRISFLDKDGKYIKSFGKKGRGNGELLGPQYIAEDSSGNLFVTDYGNSRVAVFNSEGEFLFNFGKIKSPTGIEIIEDTVFVADSVKGTIYKYDIAGNYIDALLPEKSLKKPEAIREIDGELMVCDKNRILAINPYTGTVREIAVTGNAPSKLTCAAKDANGNIIASDFKSDEVYELAQMQELVGGLYVEIVRVNADHFPDVNLEVRVENRKRECITGLEDINFLVTENKKTVAAQKLTGQSFLNDFCDITIIVDCSAKMKNYEKEVQLALKEICSAMKNGGTLRVITSSQIPLTEYTGLPGNYKGFAADTMKNSYSSLVSTDLAIRLAVNDLINASHKRAVIFIGNGEITGTAFSSYTLSVLSSYLNNNGVAFSFLNVAQKALSPELNYLVENTAGTSYYIYRPEGISGIVNDLIELPSSLYTISYKSALPTNFGKDYLPVEVEAYLLNRSGRAESGYFAPLE